MSRRLIEKTRERLSRETGTIYKSQAGSIRFALAFPNTYYVGMSSLGFQIVYRLLNEIEGSMSERVFLPDPPELEELKRTSGSLITMESQTSVRDFDVVAFSVSFELDYPNLLRMLALSRMDEVAEAPRAGPAACDRGRAGGDLQPRAARTVRGCLRPRRGGGGPP